MSSSTADLPAAAGPRRRGGAVLFVAVQAVAVAAAVAWGAHAQRQAEAERALPPLRPEPLRVTPLYDERAVVSDEQLRDTLSRLGLPERGAETVLGRVDHALRFWRPEARLPIPGVMTGDAMRRLLTNHRRFIRVYGRDREPLLIEADEGVRVRVFSGTASSPHVDHTLATLAEIGTPLDFPVVTPERRTSLRALLEQSLRDFSLNQPEYEWSTLAYALYLPPAKRWVTSEGQRMTFDRLAQRLQREALPNGVCSGNHRLYALVTLLRVDDLMADAGEERVLSATGRERTVAYLRDATANLVRHQHPAGFWNGDWPAAAPLGEEPSAAEGDRLSDRLIVTGHALEWWALAPPELLPPTKVRIAAAQWLVRTIGAMSADDLELNFSFLSHAGRALALWRGREAAAVELLPTAEEAT